MTISKPFFAALLAPALWLTACDNSANDSNPASSKASADRHDGKALPGVSATPEPSNGSAGATNPGGASTGGPGAPSDSGATTPGAGTGAGTGSGTGTGTGAGAGGSGQ